MIGVPKSTLQSTALLLLIGVGMVIVMLVVTNLILGDATGNSTNQDPVQPTPIPTIKYVPIPDDSGASNTNF